MSDHGGLIERLARRDPVARRPRAVAGEPGLFVVDATWGVIQPLQLPGAVQTVVAGATRPSADARCGGPFVR